MDKLAKAVLSVMNDVKGMEKKSKVGTGSSTYDGTRYVDVAEVFNDSMVKNGLVILPIDIQEEVKIDRWGEEDPWSKTEPKAMNQKQSVFTKVVVKYLLLHESGESQQLVGYGHGVDTQDKGAGKATTYALKNCLLYTFLTPVGKIEDTDKTKSREIERPFTETIDEEVIEKNVIWLTKDQLEKTLKSNLKGVQKTLSFYNTNSHKMKQDFKDQLENYEKELIFNEATK